MPSTAPPRALRRGFWPDPFTYSLFACAPYRGCGHGCSYCDGRAEKYFVEGDFERDIVRRDDLPARLRVELAGLREWGALSLGSGVTDAYQPCEGEDRLTRQVAQLLTSLPGEGLRPLPVVILTKSVRILEDLDLWTQINAQTSVLVMVSITSLDERVREVFEPGASAFAERLEVLRRFKAAGCLTGALVMPLLPGISDDPREVAVLFRQLEAIGVDFALPGGLTLRPGRQKEHFLAVLRRTRPELERFYRELFHEDRASGSPTAGFRRAWFERLGQVPRSLPWMLPHAGLRRLMEPQDELAVLFSQMGELYRERGVDTRPLRQATLRYDIWLKERRTAFRRRRTLPTGWLSASLEQVAKSGELGRILANPKLARFAEQVVLERALLDPVTLRLQSPSSSR